jgi:SPP1 gp7 family putative phage head morphogenesis protein
VKKAFSFDAMKKNVVKEFKPSSTAEATFSRALRKVARVAAHIVGVHIDGVTIRDEHGLSQALQAYSKTIEPWAHRQAKAMLDKVAKQNAKAYRKNSELMGKLMQTNVVERQVGETARALQNEHVALIKSIPVEAGLRAQRIAMEAVTTGQRAAADQSVIDQLTKEMGMTESVAINRAKLIAVTETARASAMLNQSRAVAVGSRQYIWRNSGDGAVRPAHEKLHGHDLDGQIFSWDKPPTLDDGTTGHPGTFPRCRCFAEPVF